MLAAWWAGCGWYNVTVFTTNYRNALYSNHTKIKWTKIYSGSYWHIPHVDHHLNSNINRYTSIRPSTRFFFLDCQIAENVARDKQMQANTPHHTAQVQQRNWSVLDLVEQIALAFPCASSMLNKTAYALYARLDLSCARSRLFWWFHLLVLRLPPLSDVFWVRCVFSMEKKSNVSDGLVKTVTLCSKAKVG